MITLKQEVIDRLKRSSKAKGRLAYEFSKTTRTIDAWLHDRDIMLTTPKAVSAISQELNVPESEVLTNS